MRFNQFLLNESNKFDDFLKVIKANCSEFLAETTLPIFRGIKNGNTFATVESRNDRTPKDSKNDITFNLGFNLGIEKLFKISQIRKKALFCCNTYSQAVSYGKVNFVFPKNGFNIIFSNEIYDSYEDFNFEDLQHLPRNWPVLMDLLANPKAIDYSLLDFVNEAEKLKFSKDEIEQFFNSIAEKIEEEKYVSTKNPSIATEKKRAHELLLLGDRFYTINIGFAAKELGVKDDESANFETNLYKKLVETINAKTD